MVWDWNGTVSASLPELWTEAPFVGNGMVGAYITVGKGSSELNIEVSRPLGGVTSKCQVRF